MKMSDPAVAFVGFIMTSTTAAGLSVTPWEAGILMADFATGNN